MYSDPLKKGSQPYVDRNPEAKDGLPTMSPPEFGLEASPEQPAQLFADPLADIFNWDWLNGIAPPEEKGAEGKDTQTGDKATPATTPDNAAGSEEKETAAAEIPQQALPPAGVFEVTDEHAYIRNSPPELNKRWPREKIYSGAKVRVIESVTKGGVRYSKVLEELGDVIGAPNLWGWTAHSNLTLSQAPTKEEIAENEKSFAEVEAKQKEKIASGDMDTAEIVDHEFELHDAHGRDGADWDGSTLNNFILEKAGIKTEEFWGNFTTIDLFGKQAVSLHKDFANLLKNVERVTIDKVAASADFKAWQEEKGKKTASAKNVGKFLGINRYSTIRPKAEDSTSSSMHMYGMAIDFNANNNPWISDSSGKMGEIKKGKLKGVNTKTQQLQDCLDRIGRLTGETLTFDHTNPDHDTYDMMDVFDNSEKMDEAFEKYFQMGDGQDDPELDRLIKAASGTEWDGKTADEAKVMINADLDTMATLWSRKGQKTNVVKHGIMDLDRRLVQAMNAVGLDWGGKYGDMMHFDMRFTGLGSKIRAAKNSKLTKDEIKRMKAEKAKK